ncbi:MAG: hypothetical protein U9O91_07700 [Candidatus Caldatribacteriota bacterium]|nr:hypothetical protein [Candidatus Caldatribacteriota bacterium]
MKSSRNLKVGVTLLVAALAIGVFALVVWADGNGTYGMRGGSKGNIETPRYGMQSKEVSNQGQTQDCEGCEDCVEGQGNGTGRRADAPDDDGDGIPNGQDSDYESICDDECDGTCDSEPKGTGMRRNSPDNISGLQAHVSGMEMKTMTIEEIAALWGVDAGDLLDGITNEFEFTQEYGISSTIDDLRGEYRFFPYQIMEIAERLKATSTE